MLEGFWALMATSLALWALPLVPLAVNRLTFDKCQPYPVIK